MSVHVILLNLPALKKPMTFYLLLMLILILLDFRYAFNTADLSTVWDYLEKWVDIRNNGLNPIYQTWSSQWPWTMPPLQQSLWPVVFPKAPSLGSCFSVHTCHHWCISEMYTQNSGLLLYSLHAIFILFFRSTGCLKLLQLNENKLTIIFFGMQEIHPNLTETSC